MNELERICDEASRLTETFLLATVLRVSGSSYRRPGARMLVTGDRWVAGCVSGGCLEGDVMLRGAHRAKTGPVVVTYDSTDEDIGLGCNGVVDVLLELMTRDHPMLAFARACFAAETAGTLITADDGRRYGTGPYTFGEPIEGLTETIAPSPQLFILGSAHDAAPLAQLATGIGFRVTVVDRAIREPSKFLGVKTVGHHGDWATVKTLIDRARDAYVVVMHHAKEADRAGIATALASKASYIGVLGPARRTAELTDSRDPRLHAPIGLDLRAETPPQIALAIAAELQARVTGASATTLRGRSAPLHLTHS